MEQVDEVTILIEDKLRLIVPFVPQFSIHRVPKGIFNLKSNAYVPKEVSIGPYHRDKNKFKNTENLKLRFFFSYLHRGQTSTEDIVKMARVWEEKARQYYSDDISMKSEEFVEMMVLDGCFIVEFMITIFLSSFKISPESKTTVHFSFYESISSEIRRDLIMLENQLPFFVLQGLFDLIYSRLSSELDALIPNFVELYFDSVELFPNEVKLFPNEVKLFLTVVKFFLTKPELPVDMQKIKLSAYKINPRHLLDFFCSFFAGITFIYEETETDIILEKSKGSPSATELLEAGIILEKAIVDGTGRIFISFKNGILNIPTLQIDDRFETYARNLLAFSQFSGQEYYQNDCTKKALNYFLLLHGLITTEEDVKLLVDKEIILNQIGGRNKEILQLFNSMCRNITLQSCFNFYVHIGIDLQQHCKRRRNRRIRRWNRWISNWKEWMVIFRTKYLSTPWALISILAATFLLILTLLQTIFAGISFFNGNHL